MQRGLTAGVVLFAVSALLIVWIGIQVENATERLVSAQQIEVDVASIERNIARAEAEVRSLALTSPGRGDYRPFMVEAVLKAGAVAAQLRDDPHHRALIDSVQQLLVLRTGMLEETAILAERKPLDTAGIALRVRDGQNATTHISGLVAELRSSQHVILQRQVARLQLLMGVVSGVQVAFTVIAVLASWLIARWLKRQVDARSQLEQQMERREHQFETLFDQTFQATLQLRPTGEVETFNRTAATLFGLRLANGHWRNVLELPWSHTSRGDVQSALVRCLEGNVERFAAECISRERGTMSLDVSMSPIRDSEGQIWAALLEARDVTEEVRAKNAARVTMRINEGILDVADEAIVATDESLQIVQFNRRAEEMFGYRQAEVVGSNLEVLFSASKHGGTERGAAQLLRRSSMSSTGDGRVQTVPVRRRDGREFFGDVAVSSLEAGGRLMHTLFIRDATDRHRKMRTQQLLLELGETLSQTLDATQLMDSVAQLCVPTLGELCHVEVTYGDGRQSAIRCTNGALQGLEHCLREDKRGSDTPDAVVREMGQPLLWSASNDALTPIGLHKFFSLPCAKAVQSVVAVPMVVRGEQLGTLAVYSTQQLDNSDLRAALEVARRCGLALDNARSYTLARLASQARDQVLGVVSHDLRNPLSAIQMCASSIGTAETEKDRRELAEAISNSTSLMQRVIRDLLDVTSIEAGRLSIFPEVMDVTRICRTLDQIYAPIAKDKQVSVEFITSVAERCFADPDRLIQAVGNLLGNAIRYSPRGGTIRVTVTRDGDYLHWSVADNGPGIPPAEIPTLFDRFWRGRQVRSDGAGLGLAIVRGIARAHGGEVSVESTVNAGSTFTLTLPCGRDQQIGSGTSS